MLYLLSRFYTDSGSVKYDYFILSLRCNLPGYLIKYCSTIAQCKRSMVRTGWLNDDAFHKLRVQKRMGLESITQLLKAHASGDKQAFDRLVPLIYNEMRRMARNRLRGERSDHTLSTTALVHEAYLKLVKFDRINWQNSDHFFAIAAQVMRNILVDYAVRQQAMKRGGKRIRVEVNDSDTLVEIELANILSVHHALERLTEIDERKAKVVECRFFGGLSVEETAKAIGISAPTVKRDWTVARAWLHRELAE
jgi:RNA polymerase sigma factor (TIGR02999 family)